MFFDKAEQRMRCFGHIRKKNAYIYIYIVSFTSACLSTFEAMDGNPLTEMGFASPRSNKAETKSYSFSSAPPRGGRLGKSLVHFILFFKESYIIKN